MEINFKYISCSTFSSTTCEDSKSAPIDSTLFGVTISSTNGSAKHKLLPANDGVKSEKRHSRTETTVRVCQQTRLTDVGKWVHSIGKVTNRRWTKASKVSWVYFIFNVQEKERIIRISLGWDKKNVLTSSKFKSYNNKKRKRRQWVVMRRKGWREEDLKRFSLRLNDASGYGPRMRNLKRYEFNFFFLTCFS